MARRSSRVERDLRTLGTQLSGWRKVQGLTAAVVAERAAISPQTLSALENGRSTTTANLLSVLRALGVAETVLDALDPLASDLGRANAARLSTDRVRL